MRIGGKKGQKTTDGFNKIVITKSYADYATSETTPNFCDKKTWYADVDRITEQPTKIDNYTVQLSRAPVIDLRLITHRERLAGLYEGSPNHNVIIKRNGVIISDTYNLISDGYTIDYDNAKITFDTDISADTIEVEYSTPRSPTYSLKAQEQTKFITYAEVQLSEDMDIGLNFVKFEVYAFGQLVSQELYNYFDIINTSNKGTFIPAIGPRPGIVVLPFDYLSGLKVMPDTEMVDPYKNEFHEIRIGLLQDVPITGSLATFSLYYYEL